jgi:hypothetical protein
MSGARPRIRHIGSALETGELDMNDANTQTYTAPKVLSGLVAYLQVDGAQKAAEFY